MEATSATEAVTQRVTFELEKPPGQSDIVSGSDGVPNGVTKKAKEDNGITK